MPIVETLQRYLSETPGQGAKAGLVFWTGRARRAADEADLPHDSQKLAG